MLSSIGLHTLYVTALYAAGRWHEKRIVRRKIIQARLDIIRQEGGTQ